MYEIAFDDKAIDFLEQLPKSKRKFIFDTIINTKFNPHKYFESLRDRTDYSFTIKNIRVVADIAERRKRIDITLIEYRSRVYQK